MCENPMSWNDDVKAISQTITDVSKSGIIGYSIPKQIEINHVAPLREKIEKAIDLAVEYGGIDGAHHKMWVIDQIIQILAGEERYNQIVADSCSGEDGPNTYEWDEGIAP
jgi:hypothetical protein